MIVEKVYLLGNGSCWNDWQDVCDQQVHFLSIFSLSNPKTDPLSIFSVTSSSVDKWWMESVNIVMLSQKCETSIKYVITFSDGNVSAFICLEVFLQFVKLRIAILGSNYLLLSENHSLGPLNKIWSLLIFP